MQIYMSQYSAAESHNCLNLAGKESPRTFTSLCILRIKLVRGNRTFYRLSTILVMFGVGKKVKFSWNRHSYFSDYTRAYISQNLTECNLLT
jgi:hypothetical protein